MTRKRIIIGVSGASGAPLALQLLKSVRSRPELESHLILSRGGALTLRHECGLEPEELYALADQHYENDEIGAAVASGSFRTAGMVVVPCSMKTLAGIVSGYSDSLLLRAADVTLKERRRLILVPRECPFSTIHLRNLSAADALGAVILPPVPAYYRRPSTIEDVNRDITNKILATLLPEEEIQSEWNGL